jgi:hypothetical protein
MNQKTATATIAPLWGDLRTTSAPRTNKVRSFTIGTAGPNQLDLHHGTKIPLYRRCTARF